MKILHVEVAEAFKELSDEDLERFETGRYKGLGFDTIFIALKNVYKTEDMKMLVDNMRQQEGKPPYDKGLDDKKAIDAVEKPSADDVLRRTMIDDKHMGKIYSRMITSQEVQNIAKQTMVLRKAHSLEEALKKESLEDVLAYREYFFSKYDGAEEPEKYLKGLYGLDFFETANALDYIIGKKALKTIINKMPKKEFAQKKKAFEEDMLSSTYAYNTSSVLNNMFKKEVDELPFHTVSEFNVNIADIGNAFYDREREQQRRMPDFLAKIKNFFTRNKQKKLTDGTEAHSDSDSSPVTPSSDKFDEFYSNMNNFSEVGEVPENSGKPQAPKTKEDR